MRLPILSGGVDRRPATGPSHHHQGVAPARARLVDLRYIKKLAKVAQCISEANCTGACSQNSPCGDPACNCVNSVCVQ
jgi:hypothetical protein